MKLTGSLALLAIALRMAIASPALVMSREDSFLTDWSFAPAKAVANPTLHRPRAVPSNYRTPKEFAKHGGLWNTSRTGGEDKSRDMAKEEPEAAGGSTGEASNKQDGAERTIEWKGKPEEAHGEGSGEQIENASYSANSPGSYAGDRPRKL